VYCSVARRMPLPSALARDAARWRRSAGRTDGALSPSWTNGASFSCSPRPVQSEGHFTPAIAGATPTRGRRTLRSARPYTSAGRARHPHWTSRRIGFVPTTEPETRRIYATGPMRWVFACWTINAPSDGPGTPLRCIGFSHRARGPLAHREAPALSVPPRIGGAFT
jgi:hypothetical protein